MKNEKRSAREGFQLFRAKNTPHIRPVPRSRDFSARFRRFGFRFPSAPFRRKNSFRDFSKLFQKLFKKTFRFSFSAPVPAGHKKPKTLPKCQEKPFKPLKCPRRDSTFPKPPRTSALFHNFSTFPQAVGFGRVRQFFAGNLVENFSLAARPFFVGVWGKV